MNNEKINPFDPGAGSIPEYVAGRDKELSEIHDIINRLCIIRDAGSNSSYKPKQPIFIIGPRGVGKTVLLNLAKEYATKKNIHVVKAKVDHFAEENVTRLIELISGTDYRTILDDFKISVPGFKATARNPFKSNDIPSALTKKLNISPVLFLLDEAHTINTDHFREFCNLVQDIQSDKLPLSVIYAGTPGLEHVIINSKATFVSRYERFYLNTIDDNSTKLALAKTAEISNINFEDKAVDYMAKLTDNYPFFIQKIGKIAWDYVNKKNKLVCGIEDAKSIKANFNEERNDFYRLFQADISNLTLIDETLEVIKLLNTNQKINQEMLMAHLISSLGNSKDEALSTYQKLYRLGIFLNGKKGIEASIPSFFNYLLKEYDIKLQAK